MARQQRSIETRSRILRSAARCCAEGGYEATSVSDICQRAGVSKGAFYHHFPTKQAVFLALLSSWLTQLEDDLSAEMARVGSVPEGLLAMAGTARRVFQEAEDQLPMFLEFWAQAARDPQVWEATIAPYRRFWAYFARMMESGIREGSLKEVDPEVAARVLVSLAVGVLLQALLDSDGADWGQVAQEGMRMLLQGLEKGKEA